MDKIIYLCELYQLPAPDFQVKATHTKSILYRPQSLREMGRADKIRACYQHCCLKYVTNEKMNNQTLIERFKISKKNAATASRIIKETTEKGFIQEEDPDSKSKKYASYIPFWA